MNSISGSGRNITVSSGRKSNISYCTCDYGLVMVQRLLIALSILFGYDLVYFPGELHQMFPFRAFARILRNFFFVTKAIRKWLAINYNDGLVPEPPVRVHGTQATFRRSGRSTPVDSCMNSHLLEGSLRHSPIDRRYIEPVKSFDLVTAMKERHNRCQDNFYPDSSDLLWQSSLSFRFLLSGLTRSFMGNIEDPDEEMNMRREEADSQPAEGAQQQTVYMNETEIKTMAKALAVAFVKMKLVEFLDQDVEQLQNTNTSSEN